MGRPTKFLVDQITTVDKDRIFGNPADYLADEELAIIEDVVTYYLGL